MGEDALLPPDAQQLAYDEVGDRQRAQPSAGGDVDAQRGRDLAQVNGVAAQRVRAARDQPPGLGEDRKRTPQVGEAPDRKGKPGGGEQVAEKDQTGTAEG